MRLAEQQKVLAHLWTDAALRRQLRENALDLLPDAELPNSEIEYFANSLLHKRRGQVEQLLPRTCRALGVQFPKLFREFTATFTPRGIHKHRDDATAFAIYLQRSCDHDLPLWIREITRYETDLIKANWLYPLVMIRHYPSLPINLLPQTGLNKMTARYIGLWWRKPRQLSLNHRLIRVGSSLRRNHNMPSSPS